MKNVHSNVPKIDHPRKDSKTMITKSAEALHYIILCTPLAPHRFFLSFLSYNPLIALLLFQVASKLSGLLKGQEPVGELFPVLGMTLIKLFVLFHTHSTPLFLHKIAAILFRCLLYNTCNNGRKSPIVSPIETQLTNICRKTP